MFIINDNYQSLKIYLTDWVGFFMEMANIKKFRSIYFSFKDRVPDSNITIIL